MTTIISATEAKNRFGEYIKRAYMHEEHLIVERDGIPVVAIVPMTDYEKIIPSNKTASYMKKRVAVASKQERARRNLLQSLAYVHSRIRKNAPHATEDEIEKDIEVAIRAVRKQS